EGRCFANCPRGDATNRHATMARITASGVAPPPDVIPNGIENTTAAAGAMCVIDWKRTSRRPMASRARPSVGSDAAFRMLTPFGEPAVQVVARPNYAKVGRLERAGRITVGRVRRSAVVRSATQAVWLENEATGPNGPAGR